jgi:hypothetical protein
VIYRGKSLAPLKAVGGTGCDVVRVKRLCDLCVKDHGSKGGESDAQTAVNRYPLYRRLGRLQDRSGRVQKFSPPPGFCSRIFQPLAKHYID